jgi:hypothetical protein
MAGGLADPIAIGVNLTPGTMGVPLPEAIQATLSKRDLVLMDGGSNDADDLGAAFRRMGPQCDNAWTHICSRTRGLECEARPSPSIPFLLVRPRAKTGHGVPHCVATQSG